MLSGAGGRSTGRCFSVGSQILLSPSAIGDGGKGRPEDGELPHLVAHLEGFDGTGSEGVPDGGRDSLHPECWSHARERTLRLLQQIVKHEDLGLRINPPVAALLDGLGVGEGLHPRGFIALLTRRVWRAPVGRLSLPL